MITPNHNQRVAKPIRSATERRRAAAAQAESARHVSVAKVDKTAFFFPGRTAISAVLLLSFLLFIPINAKASGLSVLSQILQVATALATQAQSLAFSQGSQTVYSQTIIAPPVQLRTTSLALTTLMKTYNTAMTIYSMVSTHSATLSQTMALENTMGSSPSSSIHPQYVSVYGGQPLAGSTTSTRANQIDMSDSAANEGLALANSSDQAQTILVTDSAQFLNSAANAAPGTADMLIAQSLILRLHSQSIEHHLLAAMLRQRALQTASKMSTVKQAVTKATTRN